MITFATEPGAYTEFVPGEMFPGLPGGIRLPALVGESQTYLLRENVIMTKSGLLSFSYNSYTGMLTTETVHSSSDVINIVALRKNGLDFELVTAGNGSVNINIADISLVKANFSQIRVGGTPVVETPVSTTQNISITNAGYDHGVLSVNIGDTVRWTNNDSVAHGIKSDPTSEEVFDSSTENVVPYKNMNPGEYYEHKFSVTGSFMYFDPLLTQNTVFRGVINVLPVLGYSYNNSTRTLTFTDVVHVSKNIIEVDTKFVSTSNPVTIRIDGNGTSGGYDLDISPPTIRQILNVQLMDIADTLPDTGVLEIIRVGMTPYSTDFTPLDYLLVGDSIDWGAAVTKSTPTGAVSNSSTEKLEDKVFVSVGGDLAVKDCVYRLSTSVVGTVGVGKYKLYNNSTNEYHGEYLTSASPVIIPTPPPPAVLPLAGIRLIVTETTGTTVGDYVLLTANSGTDKEPNAGERYYITYKTRKSNFAPSLVYRFLDVKQQFGAIVESFNANGSIRKINNLSLAAWLSFLNGAPGLILAQTDFGLSGNSASTDFLEAIDRLREIDIVGTVVPLTSDPIVRGYVQTHVNECSSVMFRRERMAFVSATSGTSLDELIGMARGINDKRIALITPTAAVTEVQDQYGNPIIISVEGFFLAAAVAGLNHSQRFDVAEPLTRKRIVGFRNLLNEFLKPEKDRLSEAGVLTIQTVGGSLSIRQGITTSTDSIEYREISITKITDYVAVASRAVCERFVGTKFVDETPIWAEAALANTLQSLRHSRIITAFAAISARVNPNRQDTLDISYAFRPMYALNFVYISYSINSNL